MDCNQENLINELLAAFKAGKTIQFAHTYADGIDGMWTDIQDGFDAQDIHYILTGGVKYRVKPLALCTSGRDAQDEIDEAIEFAGATS